MDEFWVWFQRVAAFVVWFVIWLVARVLRDFFSFAVESVRLTRERERRGHPYTTANMRRVVNERMVAIDLMKNGEKVADVVCDLPDWLYAKREF